jgi:signal transduction histidine kinase/ligand-binding sensor domain-containing protein
VIVTGASAQASSIGQAGSLPPDRFFRHFTDDDGLPSGVVFALAQDSSGFLWIGTAGGLARYGGRNVELVRPDLFGGGIHHLATSSSGDLAVVERGRRELWIRRAGEEFERASGPDGDPVRNVHWIQFDGGDTLWVIGEDGSLSRWGQSGRWLPSLAGVVEFEGERLVRAFRQTDGRFLSATRDSEGMVSLWRLHDGHVPERLASVVGFDIPAATVARDGSVWFGVTASGLGSVYRIRDGRPVRVVSTDHRVVDLVARGDRVYASDAVGLRILGEEGRAESIATLQGVQAGGPLLLDRESSLWLGTSVGLLQYPEPETTTWGVRHGLAGAHAEYVVVSPMGTWLSAWQGLGLLEATGGQGRWRARDVQDTYAAAAATRMCVDGDGSTWFQTTADKGRTSRVLSVGMGALRQHQQVRRTIDCHVTEDGSILILADDTIHRASSGRGLEPLGAVATNEGSAEGWITAKGDRVYVAREPEVCDASIAALAKDDAAAWTCSPLPDAGEFKDLAVVEGPDGKTELWLASFSGGVLHGVDGEWRRVAAMKEVPQRATNGLFVSPRGGIWAFGFGFVVRLAPVDGEWAIVERLGGWQGVAGEIRSLWEERDGTLWLASWRGVTRVPATARSNPGAAPSTQLVALRVDGALRPRGTTAIPPGHRVVEIEFAAGALRDPRRVRYRVRLDGVEWTETHDPVLSLAGIGPGNHEVEAAASLDGLLWGPPRRLRFRVERPWYATGWALALGAALFLGIGVLAHRLRTAHLVDLERQRTRIAMDLHDELGAGLGSLGILGGVLADGSAPVEEQKKLGELIARTAAELGGSLHDIVYSLRTGEARIESLTEQLTSRGHTLFAANGVQFLATVDHQPRGVIAPSVSRHAYRIGMEALHNAARHAHASHVELGIAPGDREGRIHLWVQDDGHGIDTATLAEPGGMGLVAMRRRAEAIGGELSVESKPGVGTRVEVHFNALGGRGRHERRQLTRRGARMGSEGAGADMNGANP